MNEATWAGFSKAELCWNRQVWPFGYVESRVVQLWRTLNGRMRGLLLKDSEEQLKPCVPGSAMCRLD